MKTRRLFPSFVGDDLKSRLQIPAAVSGTLALLLSFDASAATISAHGSISNAIAQARDGDTILVQGPAVYYEHVVITNSIRLLGTNSPVIDADGAGTPLTVSAPKVEVGCLVLCNSGRNLASFDSGVMITSAECRVHDCRIENDAFGVFLRGVSDCTIEHNEILGGTNLPSSARGNGVHLWKTARDRIAANVIRYKRDGLYLSYANDSLIASNLISETRFGIHYMYSHHNQLVGNSLTHNAVGATLMFSRQLVVKGNLLSANRRHGMVLKQIDNSLVANNVVTGQNRGLFVQQANQNRFESNLIATNDIGLYLSNISEQNVFVGNSFIRNTAQVWQPPFETEQGRNGPNSFSEKGRGNYWSDYTGADRNHDGIGDTPYHQTDAFGYLVDRHPQVRILALSPALALLRKGEELLPLLDTIGVTDLAPLINPPTFALAAQ